MWEILGNEILLHIREKHECDKDDNVWPLAKETKSGRYLVHSSM